MAVPGDWAPWIIWVPLVGAVWPFGKRTASSQPNPRSRRLNEHVTRPKENR